MPEFKIQLEDSLVQKFGYAEVDNYLKELVKKLYLKWLPKKFYKT